MSEMTTLEAWLGGESHTDAPACASPVLSAYGRSMYDALDDDARQRLVPLAERIVGTAGRPDLDQQAGLMAADWIVRTYTPAWLRLAGLIAEAESLEGLAEVRAWDRLLAIQPHLDAARSSAAAAWDAAWDAVRDAAWAAAEAAAWAAARDAAGAAARDALRPTVERLQADAIALYERMVALYEGSESDGE